MSQPAHEIIENIPFSNSLVLKHIGKMVEDVKNQLVSQLKVMMFALQIDESCAV